MSYKDKYLKYKSKYLTLRKQLGGGDNWICPVCTFSNSEFMPKCDMCKTKKPDGIETTGGAGYTGDIEIAGVGGAGGAGGADRAYGSASGGINFSSIGEPVIINKETILYHYETDYPRELKMPNDEYLNLIAQSTLGKFIDFDLTTSKETFDSGGTKYESTTYDTKEYFRERHLKYKLTEDIKLVNLSNWTSSIEILKKTYGERQNVYVGLSSWHSDIQNKIIEDIKSQGFDGIILNIKEDSNWISLYNIDKIEYIKTEFIDEKWNNLSKLALEVSKIADINKRKKILKDNVKEDRLYFGLLIKFFKS